MEVVFKDDNWFYYIENDILEFVLISKYNVNLPNIPHLKDIEVLYHYRIIDYISPVYFEHNGKYISYSHLTEYIVLKVFDEYIKDHTLINLSLL